MQIQQALYEIADAASAMTDMSSFYRRLHEIVGKLMHAGSFYVTLYDAATGLLSSPYFADERGDEPPPPTIIDANNRSLRAHVLLEGRTLHLSGTEIEEGRRAGRFAPMGTPAEDWIGVPLKMDGRVIGSLTVQSYEKQLRYEEQDVHLLEFVAQHISVALTRARAIEETRQRNTELAVINSVQEGLASSLDTQSIYTLVGDKLREIFAADTTFIAFKDEAGNLLHVHYYADRMLRRSFSRPYGTGIAEVIIETGLPLRIGNQLEQQKLGARHVVSPGADEDLNQSVLGVPIVRDGKARGAVSVQSYRVNAFDENDLRLLQTLTNAMSVALENARLFNESQQRNAELTIINSVQEGLASRLDLQAIYELVGDKLRATFHNMDISIRIYDARTGRIHYPYAYEDGQRITIEPFVMSQTGFGPHAMRTGETVVINENLKEEFEKYGSGLVPGTRMSKSLVVVPLITGSQPIGVITLSDVNREHAFSDSDVRLLQTLANSMSVALENARLWEEEKNYRKALERELEIGREIQAGFLPESLPQAEGWEIAASLMSAREVAGDFYDAFELPDGKIGLVIADVCDKGVGAALFMTLFRSLIRATASLDAFEQGASSDRASSPAERLQRAMRLTNNYIAETHGESGMFATVFFGILDRQDGRLMYINGGHEPPVILRSGAVCETLSKTGPALGAIADCRFDLLEIGLAAGDLLFAFTDGVPDSINPKNEPFGRGRLIAVLQKTGGADELVKAVQTELRDFTAGATQFDDITLLAVRRDESGPGSGC